MNLTYRLATETDLVEIVQLLADDKLGATREDFKLPLPEAYIRAFGAITDDKQQELTVVEDAGEIMATFQLSFVQYLTYQGGIRAQIEADFPVCYPEKHNKRSTYTSIDHGQTKAGSKAVLRITRVCEFARWNETSPKETRINSSYLRSEGKKLLEYRAVLLGRIGNNRPRIATRHYLHAHGPVWGALEAVAAGVAGRN
jgi:hypothetical protein